VMVRMESIPNYSSGSKTADNQGIKRNYGESITNIESADCEVEVPLTLSSTQPLCKQPSICSNHSEIDEIETSSRERILFLPTPKSYQQPKSYQANVVDVVLESPPAIDSFFFSTDSLSQMKSSEETSEQSQLFSDFLSTPYVLEAEDSGTSNITCEEAAHSFLKKEKGHIASLRGPFLKWEQKELLRLRSWLTCMCLVDFDLSLGQTLKFSYPSGQLTESEGKNVASLAFPDSHSSDVGCYNFCFRFRTSSRPSSSDMKYPYLFGFVFFCQKPDSTINRGYFQKSLVLISHLPFTKLFLKVVEIVGPLFFRYGHPILEASCRNISQWPCPTNGGKLTLPILGELVNANLDPNSTPPYSRPVRAIKCLRRSQLIYPKKNVISIKKAYQQNFTQMLAMGFRAEVAMEALEECSNNYNQAIAISRARMKEATGVEMCCEEIDLADLLNSESCIENPSGVFQDVNIYEVFHNVLGSLWFLWECVITGKPIMVISQSPEVCTNAVLGLISMIAPVIYSGDFRPYFTIYDPDFKHFQGCDKNDNLGSVVLGVTNPFFLRAYKNWENILYLSGLERDNGDGEKGCKKASTSSSWKEPIKLPRRASEQFSNPLLQKSKQNDCDYSYVDRMVSRHSPYIEPEKKILRRLIRPSKSKKHDQQVGAVARERISAINTTLLRRYFRDLTNSFLRPFHIYLAWDKKLLNRQNFNPYLSSVTLLPFSEEEFLDEIRKAPKDYFKNLPVKGKRANVVKLYSKFLRSPHFQPWFYSKREQAQARLTQALERKVSCVHFQDLVRGQTISNGVKMYREIKRKIKLNQHSKELKAILINHLSILKRAIPTPALKGKTSQRVEASRRKKRMHEEKRTLTRNRNIKYNKMNPKH